jgi:hypothetical protein
MGNHTRASHADARKRTADTTSGHLLISLRVAPGSLDMRQA